MKSEAVFVVASQNASDQHTAGFFGACERKVGPHLPSCVHSSSAGANDIAVTVIN